MSDTKNILVVVLWWLEVVVALRFLLFILPVGLGFLLNQNSIFSFHDGFLGVLALTALCHGLAGFFSIRGYPKVVLLHYLSVIVVCLATGAFLMGALRASQSLNFYYVVPPIVSFFIAVCITLGQAQNQLR